MRREHGNIEHKLYLLVACAILPALAIILYSGIMNRQQAVEQSHQELEGLANEIAHIEQGIAKQSKTLLQALAASSEIKDFDLAKCQVLFKQILQDNPEYSNISLLDGQGLLLASAVPFTGRVDLSDRLSFHEAIRTGGLSTGDYMISRVSKEPVFHFSYPVRGNDGKVIGVLILAQNLTRFLDFLKEVALLPGSRVALSDRNGTILMDRSWQVEPTRAGQRIIPENWTKISNWERDSGDFFATGYDGVMAYIHFRHLRLRPGEQPYMVVNTNTPRSILLAKADQTMWTNLTLLSLAALLALAIARSLGRVVVGRYVQAIKDSEQEFRLLAEAMPQIVWVCSPEGANIYFNRQWVDYTGLTLEESLGDGWIKPFHPDDKEMAWSAWQNATKMNAVYALECRLRRADGAYQWWLIRGVAVRDSQGAITKWFGTCTDIENLKQAQTMMVLARDEAEVASKAKSEFLANMSHEIRTPLNGIMGMLQLLDTTDQTEEQQEYVHAAIMSSRRLTNLLTDILDLSRIEAGKMPIQEAAFEVRNLLDAVRDLFGVTAKEKGIVMRYAFDERLPAVLVGDEVRVRQILFNLVGNAIKFTRSGGVSVEAFALPDTLDSVCRVLFIVSDTGEGIPDDRLEHIFQPFVQGEASYVRRFQGAGLGLSIVGRVVGLLRGGLTIESEAGQGTAVYVSIPFRLPAQDAPAPAAPLKALPSPEVDGLRILFAEDEAATGLAIKRLLEKSGYRVTLAEDGRQALKALEKASFDLILMDIQMPRMDGMEVTKAIRVQEKYVTARDVPIIAMTAYALPGDREKFMDAGMDGYISKPVEIQAVKDMIARFVPASR